MKLSVVMMVKNESQHLEECLDSLTPILEAINSELIIVDTGSDDNTVEIARQYTHNVFFHQWTNDFAEMRNISISYAKGEWLFIIDGDEIVENPQEIIDFFNANLYKKYKSASVTIKNFKNKDDKESFLSTHWLVRFFENSKDFKYEGAVHEQPLIREPIYFLKASLLHYGYLVTDECLREVKFERNTRILKEELEKDPDNAYYWYQLSKSYAAYKDYEKALQSMLKAYSIAKTKKIDLRKSMCIYTNLVFVYFCLENYSEVEKICKEALKIKDGYIDLYYFQAEAQYQLQKHNDSIKSYRKYLDMVDCYDGYAGYYDITVSNYTLGAYENAYFNLCRLYDKQNEYNLVLEYSGKIKSEYILAETLPYVINAFFELRDYVGLKNYYNEVIKENYSDLLTKFVVNIENNKHMLIEENKRAITELFADNEDEYSIFNRVRLELEDEGKPVNQSLMLDIEKLDFTKLPYCFSEIIYYLLKYQYPLTKVLSEARETVISNYFQMILYKGKKLSEVIITYLRNQKVDNNISFYRINKVLLRTLLQIDEVDDELFKEIFNRYIDEGIYYITQIYNKQVFDNELVFDTKNEEDTFFVYIKLAREFKQVDKVKYIQYLKKALNVYPVMKKGIEMIVNDLKNGSIEESNDKLMQYKKQVKLQIEDFINNSKLQEAKELICEYEKIVAKDADILCMKGIISMIEQDIESAQMFFEQGLQIDNNNFDILYNLGYIHQSNAQNESAIEYFKKAFQNANEENDADLVYSLLKELEG